MSSVELIEVGPRDGLQNDSVILPTETKVELIRKLIAGGARRLEIASFVNPRRVPQMADAEAVIAGLGVCDAVRIGLVLNQRGAERAIASGIDELGAVCVASDSFGIRNQGQDSAATVDTALAILRLAAAAGRRAQVTIAVAFGCPFEGEVSADRVIDIARSLAAGNPREIALADTIGVAVPAHVSQLVTAVRQAVAPIPVRAHFHDTRGTGIANVWAAVEAGATMIDSSIGGLGGCPFAPGAAGNVATEDVHYLLSRSGIATGRAAADLAATSAWLSGHLGKPMPTRVGDAPDFPPSVEKVSDHDC
ncbi:hydroxymethylglutaryl-CoA lyase [Novosphingobium sp.]|uniref:hydroxymethylglutaryl-CoA lyase n=1 Tax=Novosphingobium sp. TaxID=1874826 RepID=UPI0027326B74|nr:hydroxymethylglutaryl-CoA lyase [Novosphingobium sp.]MDP3908583.1 hydroxymethylglutaryl-CoA lyase [Novosphingobium sp.]